MLTLDVVTDDHSGSVRSSRARRPADWRGGFADRLANDPPQRWAARLLEQAEWLQHEAPDAALVMRVCAALIDGSPSCTTADVRAAAEAVRDQAIDDCNQVAAAFTNRGARLEAQGALTVARHLASIPLPSLPDIGPRIALPAIHAGLMPDTEMALPPSWSDSTIKPASTEEFTDMRQTEAPDDGAWKDEPQNQSVPAKIEDGASTHDNAVPMDDMAMTPDPASEPSEAPRQSRFAQKFEPADGAATRHSDPAVAQEERSLLSEISRLQRLLAGEAAAFPNVLIDELDNDPDLRDDPDDAFEADPAATPRIAMATTMPVDQAPYYDPSHDPSHDPSQGLEWVLTELLHALERLRIYTPPFRQAAEMTYGGQK